MAAGASPADDFELPQPSPDLIQDVIKDLRGFSRALRGEADCVSDGKKPALDYLLLERSADTILRAASAGLLQLDLVGLVPEAARLIAEGRARLRDPRVGGDRVVTAASASPSTLDDNHSTRAADVDEAEWRWRHHQSRVRIEEMLVKLARDGDPAQDEADELRRLKFLILAGVWSELSSKFPASLWPEAARIKHELLPGVDPWFAQPRDFIKTAWVCEFLAQQIEDRWDTLTIAEAEKITGIPFGTIWRACSKGQIETIGTGRNLRMQRGSFNVWAEGYRARKAERAQKAKNATRPVEKKFKCRRCGQQFVRRPIECPNCEDEGDIRELRPPRKAD